MHFLSNSDLQKAFQVITQNFKFRRKRGHYTKPRAKLIFLLEHFPIGKMKCGNEMLKLHFPLNSKNGLKNISIFTSFSADDVVENERLRITKF